MKRSSGDLRCKPASPAAAQTTRWRCGRPIDIPGTTELFPLAAVARDRDLLYGVNLKLAYVGARNFSFRMEYFPHGAILHNF